MSKARDLANLMSTGNELADGNISVAEINDLTATAAELNIMDGVTATAAELNFVDGVTSNVQTQVDTKQPYATIAVTVVDSGGNKYALDGTVQQLALLTPSTTYRFDQSDSSNSGHPLLFSTTSNGTHGGGSAFTTGVTTVGTAGSAGAYTQIKLEQDTPSPLYYYCSNHSGMGGEVNKTISKLSDLGITSTSTELNILDGVTSSAAELNILDGVTSTAAELNILDGVTSTAAELNLLDGVTATTAELNYVDGVTSAIQTQLDAKMTPTYTGDVDITGELIVDSYNETYAALSGTTPAVNCEAGNVFALSTSGNTTFTFTNPPASGTAYGFTLKVTAGGTHTLTWPSSVDWAGGSAPDAPASGETNILVFITYDGGTTWYGALSIDAAA